MRSKGIASPVIVEVVAIGTELLLGQIVNSNAAFIGERLAEAGLDAHYQVVVGDNVERIASTLSLAMTRSRVVIVTGGLGPTQDDLTREALCKATGRAMAFDPELATELREWFSAQGQTMPESNLRQAEYPEGAVPIANPKGTAPGLALDHDETWLFAVPGVPAEMELMMGNEILPRLRGLAGTDDVLVSRVLRTWGHSESGLSQRLDDLYHGSNNPSLAFLSSKGDTKLRITAKAPTEAKAEHMIEPLEAEIRRRLGSSIYGVDDQTIEEIVTALLMAKEWTVGTAEGDTAGMVATQLTQTREANSLFRGAIVVNAADLGRELLGLPREASDEASSEEAAIAMAEGASARLGVDVAVGLVGPLRGERTPRSGHVAIGVRTPEAARARRFQLPGDRERVRVYAANAALHLLRLAIAGEWWKPE